MSEEEKWEVFNFITWLNNQIARKELDKPSYPAATINRMVHEFIKDHGLTP